MERNDHPVEQVCREICQILFERGIPLHGHQENVLRGVLYKRTTEVGASHHVSQRFLYQASKEQLDWIEQDVNHSQSRQLAEQIREGKLAIRESKRENDETIHTDRIFIIKGI